MIKAKATINGTVSKTASLRQDKDGRQMAQFSIRLTIPGARETMTSKEVFVSVSTPADGFDANQVVVGTRIEAVGTLTFKRQGDNLYLNFHADNIVFNPFNELDGISSTMEFKGTVGKNVEEKKTARTGPTSLSQLSRQKKSRRISSSFGCASSVSTTPRNCSCSLRRRFMPPANSR